MSKERAEALMMPLVDQVTQSSRQSLRLPGSVFAFLCVLHSSLPDFFFRGGILFENIIQKWSFCGLTCFHCGVEFYLGIFQKD